MYAGGSTFRPTPGTGRPALGAMFRRGGAPSFRTGVRAPDASSTTGANRYPGTACPPGESLVRRDSEYRAPRFIGDSTRDEFVYCRPTPAPATRPAPAPTVTVSPTFQQQFTPQASPVFTQVQDSPGSTQVGTTAQESGGPQTAAPAAPAPPTAPAPRAVPQVEPESVPLPTPAPADRSRPNMPAPAPVSPVVRFAPPPSSGPAPTAPAATRPDWPVYVAIAAAGVLAVALIGARI